MAYNLSAPPGVSGVNPFCHYQIAIAIAGPLPELPILDDERGDILFDLHLDLSFDNSCKDLSNWCRDQLVLLDSCDQLLLHSSASPCHVSKASLSLTIFLFLSLLFVVGSDCILLAAEMAESGGLCVEEG